MDSSPLSLAGANYTTSEAENNLKKPSRKVGGKSLPE
jgi:hypothetical protein